MRPYKCIPDDFTISNIQIQNLENSIGPSQMTRVTSLALKEHGVRVDRDFEL